jgi:hypothetical protein
MILNEKICLNIWNEKKEKNITRSLLKSLIEWRAMTKKAVIIVRLVPESKDVDNEQIEKEIKESLKCSWLAETEKVTVK